MSTTHPPISQMIRSGGSGKDTTPQPKPLLSTLIHELNSREDRFVLALDDKWAAWFDGLTISHRDDRSTTLAGALPGQTALHSILNKVRDMNLTLRSVQYRKTGEKR